MGKFILMAKIHRHHINFGWVIFGLSSVIILVCLLWELNIINLPSDLVHYSRQLSGRVVINPGLTFELPLKFHRQEHSLSCELATLKMVLNYHGVEVSESEIIDKLPFDSTMRLGNIWGDPHLGFVGNIDGKMMGDGYGVYWEPIAAVASYWRGAKIIKNGLASYLAKHISEGRPVIVWGYLGRGQSVNWETSDGKKIYGVDGEHTRVVYGFRGSVEDPDGFMIMDPVYGPAYWEESKFMRNWEALGRHGVVVYP